ncbi:MAG: CHAT domain-containing protein [Saprospiraceae bacterium]
MRKFIPLVILLWPLLLSAQVESSDLELAKSQLKRGHQLRKAADYDAALSVLDSALFVFAKDSFAFDTLMATAYEEQALVHMTLQRYGLVKELGLRSATILEGKFGFYHLRMAKPLNLIGTAYYNQGNNNRALVYYNKSLSVMDSVATEDDTFWPVLYTNLGGYYTENYDYENAILYFNLALTKDQEVLAKDNAALLIGHYNLGTIHELSADYEKALSSYENALNVFDLNGKLDSFYWSIIHCNIGDCYSEMEEVDKAFAVYNLAEAAIENKSGYHDSKSRLQRAKGKCKLKKEEWSEAILYFEKALAAAMTKDENATDAIYDCQQHLAEAYGKIGDRQKALAMIDSAFAKINFDPVKPLLWKCEITKGVLVEGVALQSDLLIEEYKQSDNNKYLELAQRSNDLTLQIIDSIKLELKEKGSQQFVTEAFFPAYENAIAIEYELYEKTKKPEYLNYAFQKAEKCKSNILLDAVLKSKALTYGNLPPSLLVKENFLKESVWNTERRIYAATNDETNRDSVKLGKLKAKLFNTKVEMQQLLSHLEKNHKSYYNLKYKTVQTDLAKVQKELLNEQTSILSYFAGEDYFYAMLINKEDVVLKRLGAVDDLQPLVENYINTVTSFRPHIVNMEAHCNSLSALSYELYETLVAPFSENLKKEITIIPDGILTYLSFDGLLKIKPEKPWEINNYDFLLKHHVISYNYSVELLLENKLKESHPKQNQLLAIAPTFNTNFQGDFLRSEELAPLQHNIQEAQTILSICDGELLKDEDATRTHFFSIAENYRAIHFATHGKANDKDGLHSYLAFSQDSQNDSDENILFAHDIYNLNLKADLVVLSACETGIGEWNRGEGMISMARAFSYAGANHILTTLWKVNDSKAGLLMKNYYGNLQNGLGKSSALRQAKLDYLKESKLEGSHPFFWASFIPIGENAEMILEEPGWSWPLVLGAFLFVSVLLGVSWRRNPFSFFKNVS